MAEKSRDAWSFSDFLLFVAFWAGILFYNEGWPQLYERLFVQPLIANAEALEARGRLPEALDLLTAEIKDDPKNANLLWALGDYYTKADSPLLAHFYFRALSFVDNSNLEPERRDFAQPFQSRDAEPTAEIKSAEDDAEKQHHDDGGHTIFPDSANAMLNSPAGDVGFTAGYFDPNYPISATCSDGSACRRAFYFPSGNIWTAIATQRLAIAFEQYGGKGCCSLSLDDPDLRSLSVIESEFSQKLDAAGDRFADANTRRQTELAFRARLLAKQQYVLDFLDNAGTADPAKSDRWSDLLVWVKIVAWFAALLVLRNLLEGRIARWRQAGQTRVREAKTSAPSRAAAPTTEVVSRSLWWRTPYFIVALLLLANGVAWLFDSAQSPLLLSGMAISDVGETSGLHFAAGVSLILLALLAINRGSRHVGDGTGLFDRFAGWIGGKRLWQFIAGAGALGALAVFGSLTFAHAAVHWNTAEAVSAFQHDVAPLEIFVDGEWVYGISPDGETTHIARFTPTLYRAMDRAGIQIGEFKYPMQFPVPGGLPILLLIGLCALALFARRDDHWIARCFLGFALLNLYVVFWLVSAQTGLEMKYGLKPDWIAAALPLVAGQLVIIASIYNRLREQVLPARQLRGWIALYWATSLAMLPWAYCFSEASARGPALIWIALYIGLGAALWFLILRRPMEEAAL
jgi:hypothetical protein